MADDVKSDGARKGRPAETEPRRLRWSVPAVDVSTNYWLDQQENISRSLQLLIRESIQRDGYLDVVNRPVDQLPRRGRPPVESTEYTGGAGDESTAAVTDTSNEHAKPDPGAQESGPTQPAAEQPAGPEPQAPDHSDESAGDGQVDINDIMAGLRN